MEIVSGRIVNTDQLFLPRETRLRSQSSRACQALLYFPWQSIAFHHHPDSPSKTFCRKDIFTFARASSSTTSFDFHGLAIQFDIHPFSSFPPRSQAHIRLTWT